MTRLSSRDKLACRYDIRVCFSLVCAMRLKNTPTYLKYDYGTRKGWSRLLRLNMETIEMVKTTKGARVAYLRFSCWFANLERTRQNGRH